MAQFPSATVLTPALLVGAALTLSACGQTTYGTGTTAGAQTLKDVTGILSLGGRKEGPAIDYEERAPIVEPPVAALPPPGSGDPSVAAALPPPGSGEPSVAAGADWPVDPDEERKRVQALVKARADAGETLKFTPPPAPGKKEKSYASDNSDKSAREKYFDERMASKKNPKDIKQEFAKAKMAKVGSFDENGNPVRQYLIEPPVNYREPDLESEVGVSDAPKKKKKKFKFPDLWPF